MIIFLSLPLFLLILFYFLIKENVSAKVNLGNLLFLFIMTLIIIALLGVGEKQFFEYVEKSAIVKTCLEQENNNLVALQCTYSISLPKDN